MEVKQVFEELKNNIDSTFIEKFSIKVLESNKFIPLNIHNDNLCVGIVNGDDENRANKILAEVKKRTGLSSIALDITQEQFEEVIETYKKTNELQANSKPLEAHPKKMLGEILVDLGYISKEQLLNALAESKKANEPVGSYLVKANIISVIQLREALKYQQGIETIETSRMKMNLEMLDLLPIDFIKDNKVVPISSDGRTLTLGMVNPNDKNVLNNIIYLTGLNPKPMILTHIEYEKCIESIFETKKQTSKIIEEIELNQDNVIDETPWEQLEKELQDESGAIAKFATQIIVNAIKKDASDIHIEPRKGKYIVRYRIDGILRQVIEIPQRIESAVISRFKVISRMNITEHRRPQDGSFSIKHGNLSFDLRVNTLPVGLREKVVIRILKPRLDVTDDNSIIQLNGAQQDDIDKINIMTSSPHGIILVSGPTGSGKTTTLYSILNKINDEMVNITTIEDPVEIRIDGVNQVQVNPKADVTFASCMRSILRQDPDVIMVGEIRDGETLGIAIKAALTGHSVLSTIHTNSAVETITRLIDMGAASYLVASSLVGVVAQRLVRRLCPNCKEAYTPDKEELSKIIPSDESFEEMGGSQIYKPKGCSKCDFTGYLGRIGLYEVLPINREIKKMIAESSSIIDIEEVAISSGMKTLSQSCLEHIIQGSTTPSEYIRVLGFANE